MFDFFSKYFMEVYGICERMDVHKLEQMVDILYDTRKAGGRVFVIGLGGSAANASHFVNDLRKLCNIQAYCPTDNIAEFSARANDEPMEFVFEKWLKTSRLHNNDTLFVLSVGGGCPTASPGIIRAIDYAHNPDINAMVLGICGKRMGYLASHADYVIIVPIAEDALDRVTPHTEEFQGVICHALVTHPDLAQNKTVW